MSHIGNRIKQARIERGMTQEDLANALGKTKGTISRYELSSREPRYAQLCAIANALSIPVQQLAGPFPEDDPSEAETVTANIQAGEKKAKKQERILLEIFSGLSAEGQAEAVQRLSELARLPEYRQELSLPKALSWYASQKNKVDYFIMEDTIEKDMISCDAPFGDQYNVQFVRHIVLKPIILGKSKTQHFWVYFSPIEDRKTMDSIVSQHLPDDFSCLHSVAFPDDASCNLAYTCMEAQYFDTDPDDIPDFPILCVQKDETGSWTVQE